MPKGVRSEPCPKCKSKATRCACKRAEEAKASKPPPKKALTPAAPAPKVLRVDLRPVPPAFDPRALSDEDLLACVAELERREAELLERAAKLHQARESRSSAA